MTDVGVVVSLNVLNAFVACRFEVIDGIRDVPGIEHVEIPYFCDVSCLSGVHGIEVKNFSGNVPFYRLLGLPRRARPL